MNNGNWMPLRRPIPSDPRAQTLHITPGKDREQMVITYTQKYSKKNDNKKDSSPYFNFFSSFFVFLPGVRGNDEGPLIFFFLLLFFFVSRSNLFFLLLLLFYFLFFGHAQCLCFLFFVAQQVTSPPVFFYGFVCHSFLFPLPFHSSFPFFPLPPLLHSCCPLLPPSPYSSIPFRWCSDLGGADRGGHSPAYAAAPSRHLWWPPLCPSHSASTCAFLGGFRCCGVKWAVEHPSHHRRGFSHRHCPRRDDSAGGEARHRHSHCTRGHLYSRRSGGGHAESHRSIPYCRRDAGGGGVDSVAGVDYYEHRDVPPQMTTARHQDPCHLFLGAVRTNRSPAF
ncbi:hypothetical protein TCSYLVIO_005533 [Trypanosoma cruzi]|nr:hypothetical protein TCSYLVIO_005533 [Trypanosoma cruzi]